MVLVYIPRNTGLFLLRKTKAVERKMVLTPNWLHEAAMLNDVVKIESQSLLKSYEVNINFNDRLQ